jgi:hypothetical protein
MSCFYSSNGDYTCSNDDTVENFDFFSGGTPSLGKVEMPSLGKVVGVISPAPAPAPPPPAGLPAVV